MKPLSEAALKYIVARLIDNANEALQESKEAPADSFKAGRRLAYYEMLDILQAELDAHDADLKEYGLDFDVNAHA